MKFSKFFVAVMVVMIMIVALAPVSNAASIGSAVMFDGEKVTISDETDEIIIMPNKLIITNFGKDLKVIKTYDLSDSTLTTEIIDNNKNLGGAIKMEPLTKKQIKKCKKLIKQYESCFIDA